MRFDFHGICSLGDETLPPGARTNDLFRWDVEQPWLLERKQSRWVCGLTSSDPRPWAPSARRSGVRFLMWTGRRRTCCLVGGREGGGKRERKDAPDESQVFVNAKRSHEAPTDLWPPSAPAQC